MTEFELINRFFAPDAGRGRVTSGPAPVLGIGDDCALLMPPASGCLLAISTDMLIEGRHFFAGTAAAAIGHKTLAVNLSDLAAMGAEPLGFTLALAVPDVRPDWLEAFSSGLLALADRHRCPLVGGDTTRGPLCLSVTVFGSVPSTGALRRDGARAGDDIWVSGWLGAAAHAVRCRQLGREAMPAAAERLDWPRPRLALGLALRGLAGSAIDLSDGLAGDLAHVLKASSAAGNPLPPAMATSPGDGEGPAATGPSEGLAGASGGQLGACLEVEAIPVDPALRDLDRDDALGLALQGGDDYELLFTASPRLRGQLAALATADGFGAVGPQRIGTVTVEPGIRLRQADGSLRPLTAASFDHFAAGGGA